MKIAIAGAGNVALSISMLLPQNQEVNSMKLIVTTLDIFK
jgi:hypothetical protein